MTGRNLLCEMAEERPFRRNGNVDDGAAGTGLVTSHALSKMNNVSTMVPRNVGFMEFFFTESIDRLADRQNEYGCGDPHE
jgi:hypothetical protein